MKYSINRDQAACEDDAAVSANSLKFKPLVDTHRPQHADIANHRSFIGSATIELMSMTANPDCPWTERSLHRRIIVAVVTVLLEGAVIWLLLTASGVVPQHKLSPVLTVLDVKPLTQPIAPKLAPKALSRRPEGAASPPNLRSRATEIVAPPPVIPPTFPPLFVVSKVASIGSDATSGAAPITGPGTGAGGVGTGSGSGGAGDGDGGGGFETPPRLRRGRLKDSDYPTGLGEGGISGTVTVRYLVIETGRVQTCEIIKSSGSPLLDETTCRLIRERFRFEPSRDAAGHPIAAYMRENHSWSVEDDKLPN